MVQAANRVPISHPRSHLRAGSISVVAVVTYDPAQLRDRLLAPGVDGPHVDCWQHEIGLDVDLKLQRHVGLTFGDAPLMLPLGNTDGQGGNMLRRRRGVRPTSVRVCEVALEHDARLCTAVHPRGRRPVCGHCRRDVPIPRDDMWRAEPAFPMLGGNPSDLNGDLGELGADAGVVGTSPRRPGGLTAFIGAFHRGGRR
jgi:hypothetical protein